MLAAMACVLVSNFFLSCWDSMTEVGEFFGFGKSGSAAAILDMSHIWGNISSVSQMLIVSGD